MQYDRLDVRNVSFPGTDRTSCQAQPDSSDPGLHRMIDHTLSEGGGVTTKDFTAHMIAEKEAGSYVNFVNRCSRLRCYK